MSTVLLFVLGLALGIALGLVFFGGLWWTAQRLTVTARPAVIVAVSLLFRLGVLAVVLVVLARLDVVLLVGAVAGVVAARVGLTRAAVRGVLPSRVVAPSEEGR